MSFISASYSVKKLSDKRYTSENITLTTEAFVSPFDINANEVYTDFRYIPTSSAGLPYSGSTQDLGIVSASATDPTIATEDDVAVLKYWYRKKLRRGNQGGRSTWFFVEDDGFGSDDAVFNDQLITSSQQTNFISPKYIISDNSLNTAESATPGYRIQVTVGTDAASATNVINTSYVFDYKTGILSFLPGKTPVEVSNTSNYVFVSAYQYVGRTLSGQIADGSIGGGAGSWNELTDIPDGLISGSQQITDFGFISSSTAIASDISGSWQGQGFISASQVQGNIGGGVISGSAQIASAISGSTRIYVSGSDGGFDVGQDSTLNFVSGTAGLTVVSNGSDTITIGASTDDVTFNSVTADTLTGTASFANKVVINKAFTSVDRPIILSETNPLASIGQLAYTSGSYNAGLTYNVVTSELKLNGPNTNLDILTISTSSISVESSITNYDLFNTNVTTLNFGGDATNINMGASNGTVNIAGSASIAGDLIVQGTVTSIQTENLNVSDQFILLASGSTGTKDGGIIVQSGSNGVGTALYFDANANRWAVNPANTVNWNDTALTPKQYVVSVSSSAAAPTGDPSDFGTENASWYGMMYVDTSDTTDGGLYIYLP